MSLPEIQIQLLPETRAFWSGVAAGRVDMPWCASCDGHVWPPRSHCPRCLGVITELKQLSGEGAVYSFSVVHRGEGAFAKIDPYVLAYVSLDGGPTVMANVVDIAPADVTVGMRVRLRAQEAEPGTVGMQFVPAS